MPTWKLALKTFVACLRSLVFLKRLRSLPDDTPNWGTVPKLGTDCPHLKADHFRAPIFIVRVYTWGEEGCISVWEHCIGELCLLFYRMGDSAMPVTAGRATTKWAMGTAQPTAETLAGSGCLWEHRSKAHHAQPHKGTWCPLCRQISSEIMNWPSPKLPLKRLKVLKVSLH